MSKAFPNRYAGVCGECGQKVAKQAGLCRREKGGWETYHRECFPEQIKAKTAKAEITADGHVYFPYNADHVRLVKTLAGARFNSSKKGGDDSWSVSTAPGDRRALLDVAARIGLEVAPELQHVPEVEQVARAKALGAYDYQVEGIEFLANREKALVGDEMGCGKTLQTLVALAKDARILCVVPKSLLLNWVAEARKWAPHFTCTIISKQARVRDCKAGTHEKVFRLPKAGEIVLVNFEGVPDEFIAKAACDVRTQKVINVCEADKGVLADLAGCTLVVDEAHKVKGHKSRRNKKIKMIASKVEKAWFLTATPYMTRPMDFYGLLQALGTFYTTFRSYDNFKKLFGARQGRYGTEWGQAAPEVPELLRNRTGMIRRLKRDVLAYLPPKIRQVLPVNGIPAKLQKQLDALQAKFAEILAEVDRNEERDDEDAKPQLPPFESFAKVRAEIAEFKTMHALEIIEDFEEQEVPALVFSAHRHPIDTIAKRKGWASITGDTPADRRQQIVDDFQAGKLKGVAMTIAAGGVGLTLTRAEVELFVDYDWTPANNHQAEDRAHRPGQKNSVVIKRLQLAHPLEEHIDSLIERKIIEADKAVDSAIEVKPVVLPTVTSETQDEFVTRTRPQKASQFADALNAAREDVPTPAPKAAGPRLTDSMKADIDVALRSLLGVCDGAREKDGCGFNGYDAQTARDMYARGLQTNGDYWRAYHMMKKYHRQIGHLATFAKKGA